VLAPGELVTAADLEACCVHDGLPLEPGIAVLAQTGNGRFWHDPQRYRNALGIAPDASRWLAAHRPSVVGCDTMTWDLPGLVDPELGCDLPGHVIFLVQFGIPKYPEPGRACSHGARRFTLVCTPLQLVGAASSPVCTLTLVRA
ncbi:MAG: cyclase family protein, partial [Thermomicrobium sp.]